MLPIIALKLMVFPKTNEGDSMASEIPPIGSIEDSKSTITKPCQKTPTKPVFLPPCTPQASFKKLEGDSLYIKKLKQITITKQFEHQGRTYHLGARIGAGDYSEVYLILEDLKTVLKISQTRRLTSESALKRRLEYIKEQYEVLGGINKQTPPLHQAQIRNIDTLVNDGFLLVEHIPTPFPEPSWVVSTCLSNIDSQDITILQQVKKLFEYLVEKDIFIDLKRDNVGLSEDRAVKLFDWHEEPDERDELQLHLEGRIRSFAKGRDGLINLAVFNALHPNTPNAAHNLAVQRD